MSLAINFGTGFRLIARPPSLRILDFGFWILDSRIIIPRRLFALLGIGHVNLTIVVSVDAEYGERHRPKTGQGNDKLGYRGARLRRPDDGVYRGHHFRGEAHAGGEPEEIPPVV